MPGFLSWISGFFSKPQPVSPAPEPRLFNPAQDQFTDEDTETGALLARQLEEHLFCWLLDVAPSELEGDLSSVTEVIDELQQRLSAGRLEELPRQPLSLPTLMRALSDDTTDRQSLTDIILGDPALTDQLLQMANSPYFRHGDQTIDSVDQAVFLLGLDGIRNVVSAAVMRPMMAARNSQEALFAQRVWRWGLTCARASELSARAQKADSSAHFMAGLLPALAYITIRRELHRICRARLKSDPTPALIRHSLVRHQWATSQLLANEWNLPPQFNALLLGAERPAPRQTQTPLNDGMIIGTREVLRHANQRNLAEEDLPKVLQLAPEQINQLQHSLTAMLQEGGRSTTRV
ncbi:HDOD domain-containing protein [Marinobacter sp. M216]|uniref:HDOD domain-containing protein n=1 Tax=Marinobacter albus TaxID=3030833 RepID=A0ABT7HA02_9GAMM|nr:MULTISPECIES: HDOD domain-containing protein [unclassified Marinobacter]MBW7470943.1 HDOD domain-containing protein [Marinobacter sp. F4218]MDK9556777.1 HDOD domain-containing protein [Marinobacter sp. M216]